MREQGTSATRGIAVVDRELTADTASALIDGVITVVLSHPLGETLIDAMAEATTGKSRDEAIQRVLPFEIYTAQNV